MLNLDYPSVDLEFLEAFYWDYFIAEFLPLHHTHFNPVIFPLSTLELPYSVRLVKLGDNWTHVILNCPSLHFDQLCHDRDPDPALDTMILAYKE